MSWEEQLRKRRMLLSGQFKGDPALHDVFKKPPKAEALKEKLFAQRKAALARMVPAIPDDDVFQPPPPKIKGKEALVVEKPGCVGGRYYVNPFEDAYSPITPRERGTSTDTGVSSLDSNEQSRAELEHESADEMDGKLDVNIELASAADDMSLTASTVAAARDDQSHFSASEEQQSLATATDAASVASILEDPSHDSRYFGSTARPQFFKLYRQLSHQIASSSTRQTGQRRSLDDTDSSDEDDDATVNSARHQFLRKVIHHGNLLPLPLVIRRENTSVLDISHRSLGDQYVLTIFHWL